MKKIIFAVIALFFIMEGFGQSGDKNLQTRKVAGFQGVEVSGGIDLYLSSGPESVQISAFSIEVRDHIVTEVIGGVLRIHPENNWNHGWGNSKMKAYVSIQTLKSLGASGGGDVYLQNQINAEDIDVNLSGGSNLKGKLNAKTLYIKQSGGSDVDLTGSIDKLVVEASGGSDLDGYGLVADYASLNTSGGSDCHLTVNKELSVVASGGSDVSYKGAAKAIRVSSSGSSSIHHKD